MSDRLRITADNLMNPQGETLLRNNEVFAEFHNPYKSEHLKSQAEAHELQLEAARKMLEQAPISPEMQSLNNIAHVSSLVAEGLRGSELVETERKVYNDPSLTETDFIQDEYRLAG